MPSLSFPFDAEAALRPLWTAERFIGRFAGSAGRLLAMAFQLTTNEPLPLLSVAFYDDVGRPGQAAANAGTVLALVEPAVPTNIRLSGDV